MSVQMPIELHYNDDLTISIAGPASEIRSFLNLDSVEDLTYQLPFLLEIIDEEGERQPIEPMPILKNRLERLAKEISVDAQPRGRESEIWIPDGFDVFWSEILSELSIQTDVSPLSVPRSSTLSDGDVIKLFQEQQPLTIGVNLQTPVLNTFLTIPSKETTPGKIHFLAFNAKLENPTGQPYIDVRAHPIEQVQIFIGPTELSELTCSTNRIPLKDWDPANHDTNYRRCSLPDDSSKFGVVLFNKDPKRPCTYSLTGICRKNKTSIV